MRILLVHNRYLQRGGEDAVFERDSSLLRRHGHTVTAYERSNSEIQSNSALRRLSLAYRTVWASDSAHDLAILLRANPYDVVHFYNTFPLVSPAAYYACMSASLPVVQTIQNYRLACPAAVFFRDGRLCEDCLTRILPWPGVWHGCYRSSHTQSLAVSLMLSAHRLAGTWSKRVHVYLTPTAFMRNKLVAHGLPADAVAVRPNFLDFDPGARTADEGFALYVGRLAAEKGVDTLLAAMRAHDRLTLRIAGDGPCLRRLRAAAASLAGRVQFLGWRSAHEVTSLMKKAAFVVVPSLWYEGLPLTIVEALACAVPVIASRLGGLAEVVTHERSGLLFEAGNAQDLAGQMHRLLVSPRLRVELGVGARAAFEHSYTAAASYPILMDAYAQAARRHEASQRI